MFCLHVADGTWACTLYSCRQGLCLPTHLDPFFQSMVDMMSPALANSRGEICPPDLLIYKHIADCALLHGSPPKQAELPL